MGNSMKTTPKIVYSAVCMAAVLVLSASITQAQLIDVQITGNSVGNAYAGGGVPTQPQTGGAVLGSAGDTWNTIPDSALTFSAYPNGASASGLALNYANGTASPVTLSLTGDDTWDNNGTFGSVEPAASTTYGNLFSSLIAAVGDVQNFDFAGLAPDSMYELVVYSAGNQAGRVSTFTVNSVTLSSTFDDVTTGLVQGVDYVNFASVESNASGDLNMTFGVSGGDESDINGVQLIQVVPEPSTFAILAAGGGVMLLGWRRSFRRA